MEELVAPRAVVLAAGTVGNIRAIATSQLGSDLPRIGSGFMDHVSTRAATARVHDWSKFRAVASSKRVQGVLASPRLVPTPEYFRERAVLPSFAHWEFALPESSGARSMRRFFRASQSRIDGGRLREGVLAVVRSTSDLTVMAESLSRALVRRERPILRNSEPFLRIDSQQPQRESTRVQWTRSEDDAWNLNANWSVGEAEMKSRHSTLDAILEAAEEMDLGAELEPLEDLNQVRDTYHLMGGTVMGSSAADSVVDANCLVHNTQNVFVAGASVFPSGGVANPTFTALALTHRISEILP
ncbi:hypothetical protein DVJ78_07250 [Humibacter sp. BT305]|nr:hypothetical protein DVJ78_07250 [Humibacter sp. BT305]